MKTAISIPDEVYGAAEELVERLGTSRSQLYSRALAEFVARHSPDRVTAALDGALVGIEPEADPFVEAAAEGTLRGSDW
jgi:metal-responsive CopG/Arc/MetJ family transcriptional regulator